MDEDIIEAAINAVFGRDAHLKVRRATRAIPASFAEVIDGGEAIHRAVGTSADAAKLKLSRMILAEADSESEEIVALRAAVRQAQEEQEEEEDSDDDSDDLFDRSEEEDRSDEEWDDEDEMF